MTAESNRAKLKHLPEIDGLRAIAVLLVVGHHAKILGFGGGYFGVDVFFVVSGFVITRRVTEDLKGQSFSIFDFYRRRLRRILPAVTFVLAVTTALAHKWLLPTDYVSLARMLRATVTLRANSHLASETDYFSPETAFMPLAHLWSLAIEEQFYLFYPLLCLVLATPKRLNLVLACMAIGSLFYMLFAELDSRSGYLSTVPRVFQLAAGSLCVSLLRWDEKHPKFFPAAKVISGLSFVSLLAMVPFYSSGQAVPSLASLLPVGASCVVLSFPRPRWLGLLLCNPLLRLVGLASFSIYLIHQPLMAFMTTVIYGTPYSFPTTMETLLIVGGCLILGIASWRIVEEPVRRSRGKVEFVSVVLSILILISLFVRGGSIVGNDGFPERIPEAAQLEIQRRESAMNSNGVLLTDECSYTINLSELSVLQVSRQYGSCSLRFGAPIVVVGDSHAEDLFNALGQNLRNRFILGIFRGDLSHADFMVELEQQIEVSTARIGVVVLTLEGSTWIENNKVQSEGLAADALQIIEAAKGIANRASFVWFGPQIEPRIDLYSFNPLVGSVREQNTVRLSEVLSMKVDELLRALCESEGIAYLSKIDVIEFDYTRDFEISEGFTYSDRTHWSTLGERYFGKRLLADDRVREVLKP
jgi:peptidoglycan/LPS O-acetylase OafA/YrhL